MTAVPNATAAPAPRRLDPTVLWAFAAAAFWGVMALLGVVMFNASPRIAAFDLDLLVGAGRAVAAGRQPYDPAILAGAPPDATGLFYSYPPLVGQLLAPISGLPLGWIAIGWSVLAVAGLAAVAARIRSRLGSVAMAIPTRAVVAGTIAVSAMALPMVIAVLFGNLDAFFPALYGLVLVAALSSARSDQVAGGVAHALATITKVYPGALGLWFLVRFVRDRGSAEGRRWLVPAVVAAVTAVAIVGLSVLVFGMQTWGDYATVASTAARAEIVDHRNDAPAAQIALMLGADSGVARLLHLPVLAAALVALVAAAWRVADPLESLAIAATASLFVLPISWVHYPAVLIPFGVAAVIRTPSTGGRARVVALLTAALVIAALSILWLPLLWVAIGLALAAIHLSARPSCVAPAVGAAVG
jgi:hypothetical protein